MSTVNKSLIIAGIFGIFIYMIEDFHLNFIWKFLLLFTLVTITKSVADRLFKAR
ncbi:MULTISPECIES: hypothetical protein [unclassified Lysinibacillus]|uniref:hypothetical protein n=1 Tax=unclassified Lysinibacillus TaxID=2636778 RepID=UPI0020125CBE|nr:MULTISPECIES: hypothetical protein [unclassified Lysinibacillus]MCL1696815.1 hypothetical protein [Lysinibacillus sp. BPa_S21]MCL1703475.1 hypothetical protein [Lysinibacillus sp. Bpr_S20]